MAIPTTRGKWLRDTEQGFVNISTGWSTPIYRYRYQRGRGGLTTIGVRLILPSHCPAFLGSVQRLTITNFPASIPTCMDLTAYLKPLTALHREGHRDSALAYLADMCRNHLYPQYLIPDTETSHIVHYTTIDSLLSMLGIDAHLDRHFHLSMPTLERLTIPNNLGFLRIYDTTNVNDPDEGRYFVNAVPPSNPFLQKYPSLWNLFQRTSLAPAYSASLVCVTDWQAADDLVFWRTYGNNGTGCALAFPTYCFHQNKNLYRVRYGPSEVGSCLDELLNMFDMYSTVPDALDIPTVASSKGLSDVLSPLVYLHKSEAYSYEHEARIVVPFSDALTSSLHFQIQPPSAPAPKWRHYVDLPDLTIKKLLVSDARLILGPAVQSPKNIKFVLQLILDHLELYGVQVETSTISYRAV